MRRKKLPSNHMHAAVRTCVWRRALRSAAAAAAAHGQKSKLVPPRTIRTTALGQKMGGFVLNGSTGVALCACDVGKQGAASGLRGGMHWLPS